MTLIEVLVALVILAVGLLTVIGLQMVSKRSNLDAGQRTFAARIAGSMVERMRTNRSADALQIYVGSGSALGGGSISTAPSPDCSSSTCSTTQLARYDLWRWENEMDGEAEQIDGGNTGGLAFPSGCITGPGDGSPGIYTVTLAWRGGTELPDAEDVDCGSDNADYGDAGEFRRTLTLEVYITN